MGTNESIVESIIQQPAHIAQEVHQETAIEEMAEHEIEEKAKAFGWKPEYDGPNKKSAKEFLETGEKILSNTLQEKDRLKKENEILRRSYEQMMTSSAETVSKLKNENEKRIQDLESVKKTAKENLDVEGLENAITEQNKLINDNKTVTQPVIDPTVQLWAQNNADFVKKLESDPALERHAESIALAKRDELMKFSPAERFQKVMEQLIEERPDKFGNPNQEQAPRTLTMNRTQTPVKPNADKLTISTLPAEDKAAYDVIVKYQRFKTPEAKKAYDERFLSEYKISKNIK